MKFSKQILLAMVATATTSVEAFAPQSRGRTAAQTQGSARSKVSVGAPKKIPGQRQQQRGLAVATADEIITDDLMSEIELETQKAVDEMLDEECEVDEDTGEAMDEICLDEEKKEETKRGLRRVISQTLQLVRGNYKSAEDELIAEFGEEVFEGDILERGWEIRGNSSSVVRNAEIWKFALKAVFAALKPRKMKKAGASEEEVKAAQIEAAEFIRDNLLKLGPSFVKVSICTLCMCVVSNCQRIAH